MTAKYGLTYQVAEFVQRVIPGQAPDPWTGSLAQSTFEFLKRLDSIQSLNPRVTLTFHAADGLWVYLDGSAQLFVKPNQKYLLLHFFWKSPLCVAIEKQRRLFKVRRKVNYAVGLWRVGGAELSWLVTYIARSWKPSKATPSPSTDTAHPRYFPGIVRQSALTAFIASGRICMGIEGRRAKHKISKNTPVEFDHILPHAHGGASTEWNVQVLCKDCNRSKRATAS